MELKLQEGWTLFLKVGNGCQELGFYVLMGIKRYAQKRGRVRFIARS